MRWGIPLLLITGIVLADNCPSLHYCHTSEIKYRAFNELPGAYLNSTDKIMKTFPASTSSNCMSECTHTENCQSANYYQKENANEMICDLIQSNKWSNASLLVKRDKSTHYFVMVRLKKCSYLQMIIRIIGVLNRSYRGLNRNIFDNFNMGPNIELE